MYLYWLVIQTVRLTNNETRNKVWIWNRWDDNKLIIAYKK